MSFDLAIQVILKNEGGLANDPDDRGGLTKWGITQSTYDADRRFRKQTSRSVRDMAREEMYTIYRRDYFVASGASRIAETLPRLQLHHFDCAVNCGSTTAVKILQASVGVKVDGVFGPKTLAVVNAGNDDILCDLYAKLRKAHYDDIIRARPTQEKFKASWYHRVDRIQKLDFSTLKPNGTGS